MVRTKKKHPHACTAKVGHSRVTWERQMVVFIQSFDLCDWKRNERSTSFAFRNSPPLDLPMPCCDLRERSSIDKSSVRFVGICQKEKVPSFDQRQIPLQLDDHLVVNIVDSSFTFLPFIDRSNWNSTIFVVTIPTTQRIPIIETLFMPTKNFLSHSWKKFLMCRCVKSKNLCFIRFRVSGVERVSILFSNLCFNIVIQRWIHWFSMRTIV